MVEPLYNHQIKIIGDDQKWVGIFTGTGTAKTRTALEMAEGRTLIICPKQQREDRTWQRNASKFHIVCNLTVVSKEDFKRDWQTLPAFDTVIIDECHNNLGVTANTCQRKGITVPKTSQIFEATLLYLRKFPPTRFYLCSATPISPANPMNLWAIATLMRKDWSYLDFRSKFYVEIRIGQRRVWVAKKDQATKQHLAELVKRFGYTGALSEFFDVPEQTHREVKIDLTPEQKVAVAHMTQTEADPLVRRARLRTIENGVLYGQKVEQISDTEDRMTPETKFYPSKKIDYILERAIEFPKLLIFANYKAQIHAIATALKEEGYNVSTLTGETKDRANLIIDAENAPAHIVIAQSSISSGYELPSFPCVIYASKSWQYVHYEQSLGRVLRSNRLKKNLYIHLVVDGCDGDCHKAIMSGVDFAEKLTTNI